MAGPATRGGVRVSAAPGAGLRESVELLFQGSVDAPSRIGVGVEVELIPVHGSPPRPTPLLRTRRAILAHDPELLVDACITFEPGGQVELSPPPQPSPAELLDALDGLLARLDGALARDGIVAISSGVNPWHGVDDIPMQLDAERYRVMQRHFDAAGPAGRQMMRLTAGLQVCLDMLPGDDGIEQWLLANRMGPALCAAFANSAVGNRAVTGLSGTRCRIWQQVDATRTGFDGEQVSRGEPAGAYARFAAAAPPMPLARGNPATRIAHHLSTLFPPVRPRGYLEIRYLDAPPRRWLAVPLLVVDTLLRDAEARRTALDTLADVDRATLLAMWEAAAHQGVVNPWLRRDAVTLVDIALDTVTRTHHATTTVVPRSAVNALRAFRNDYLCAHRCWSDDQVERINGPDAEDPAAWT